MVTKDVTRQCGPALLWGPLLVRRFKASAHINPAANFSALVNVAVSQINRIALFFPSPPVRRRLPSLHTDATKICLMMSFADVSTWGLKLSGAENQNIRFCMSRPVESFCAWKSNLAYTRPSDSTLPAFSSGDSGLWYPTTPVSNSTCCTLQEQFRCSPSTVYPSPLFRGTDERYPYSWREHSCFG